MQVRECKIYQVRWDNKEKEESDMEPRDYFFFDKMLTPKVMTIVYWLMLIGVVIGGLTYMFTVSFLTGLLALVAGLIAVRIWCELAVIFFKMNDALQAIRNR
jgi:hypothetical protein